jgi:hypothetical protein
MALTQQTPLDISGKTPHVLVLFFSFSGQTVGLVNHLTAGLKDQGAQVVLEKLRPVKPLRFPVGSIFSTIILMLTTLLRFRIPIQKLSPRAVKQNYDLIVLAGPTWSYNPSGPVLALLDRDGRSLLRGRTVLPLISCRGYWRVHWYGLRRLLRKCEATVPNVIVFSHPAKEPWRTIGVFLKIAGKNPERAGIIGRHYRHYGHSRKQWDEAWRFGLQIGEALCRQLTLSQLDFRTKLALP